MGTRNPLPARGPDPGRWSQDNPRNLARTIHPSGEFAIVLATGDEWTGRAEYQAGPRHARGYATEQAIYANGQLAGSSGAQQVGLK